MSSYTFFIHEKLYIFFEQIATTLKLLMTKNYNSNSFFTEQYKITNEVTLNNLNYEIS